MNNVDQDQTAQNVQSGFDLHCPHFHTRLQTELFLHLAMEVYF